MEGLFRTAMLAVLVMAGADPGHAQGEPRAGTALPNAGALMRFPVIGDLGSAAPAVMPKRVDHSSRLPRSGDQGMTNTCAGWAVGYALCSAIQAELAGDTLLRQEAADPGRLFSPSYIYAHALRGRPCGSDVFLSDALNVADSLGCCLWADMPFDTARVAHACTEVPAPAEQRAVLFRLSGIERIALASVDGVREALASGRIVVINADVEDTFVQGGDSAGGVRPFVWRPVSFANTFGHAMVIMGYDDGDGTFLVQNSWGPNWGLNGTFRMPYKVHKAYVSEAYAVDPTVKLVPLLLPAAPSDTARRTGSRTQEVLGPGETVTHHDLQFTALQVGPDAQGVLLRAHDATDGTLLHHVRIPAGGSRTIHHDGQAYTLEVESAMAGTREALVRSRVRPAERDPELRRSLRRARRLGMN